MTKTYNPDSKKVIKGSDDDEQIIWSDTWLQKLTVFAKGGNDLIDFQNSRYKNILYGELGKDSIYGGSASDTLYGGSNNDYICGFNGNDFLYGNKGNDTIYGGKGNDYIKGDKGKDYLFGNEGNDTIYGYKGNDYIYGDIGKDKLYGENGNDTIYGNSGKDTLYGNNGDDILYGDSGKDKIYGGIGNDTIYGGSGNDKIYGEDGDDIIVGDDGNDIIYGGLGNDQIYGEHGRDTIYTDAGNDLVSAGNDKDTIYVSAGNNTIYGGSGNDKIYINDGSNFIFGNTGNDKIYIKGGNNILLFQAGDGNDIISNSSFVTTFDFYQSELNFNYDNSDLIISYGNNDTVRIKNYINNTDKYFIKTNNSKIAIEDYKNSISRGDKGITVYLEKGKQTTLTLRDTFDKKDYKYTLSSITNNNSVYLEYLANGRLYIKGKYVELTANSNQKDDLIILGGNNIINTGDKDDIVRSGYIIDSNGYYNIQSNYNTINTGSGNDYVTYYGFRNTINTGSGNDNVYGISASVNQYSQNITNSENILIGEQNTSTVDGKIGNVYQGYVGGDCRFLAIMQSLSRTSDFKLSNYISITTNSNNTYTVKYNNYKSGQNTINVTSSDLQGDLCVYGDLDVVIADIALNKLISINKDAGNSSIYNADYNTLSDYIFGTKSTTYIHPTNKYSYEEKFEELWNCYKNDEINNFTVGIFAGEDLSQGIVAAHAYAVQNFSDDYITLTNVWDTLDHLTLDTDTFFNLSTSVFVYGCNYYQNSDYIVHNSAKSKDGIYLYDYEINDIQNEIASWNTTSYQDSINDIEYVENPKEITEIFAVQDKLLC